MKRSKPIKTGEVIPEPPRNRKGGAPKGSENHKIHGHYQRKSALMQVGFDGIDKRTSHGREFVLRRESIYTDLGGKDALTQIQHDLIERYMRICVLIDSLDNWIFQQPSIMNKAKRCLFPIIKERMQLEDSALRLANSIGLERKEKPVPDLSDYLAGKEAGQN